MVRYHPTVGPVRGLACPSEAPVAKMEGAEETAAQATQQTEAWDTSGPKRPNHMRYGLKMMVLFWDP